METYLASVLDGEISSYEPVVNEHQREVWGVLGVLLLDRREATAAAKDVFLRIYAHLGQYDPQYPFTAFVRTLARQHVREYLQNQAGSGKLPVFRAYVNKVFADDAAAAAHMHKAAGLLEKNAAELPAFVTQLLHRRYDLGENYQQIAKATKRPIAAVRQTLRRAQTDLADRLIHTKRPDPTAPRSTSEELTLKLLDGSIDEHERANLERLLLSQSAEVPKHIALMEVEAWLRSRWRDPKLGRSVINAISQSLRDKRMQQQATRSNQSSVVIPTDDLPDAELAAAARSAAASTPRRRRRRNGVPLGLIALLLAAMALAGVGWFYYQWQLSKLDIPETSVQVVTFDGITNMQADGKTYQATINYILNPPAAVNTKTGGTTTVQYNPKLRLKIGNESRVLFETNTSVPRRVQIETGELTLDRQADAPGPAPMIIAGAAEIVPGADTTQMTVALGDNGICRIDVSTGGATVNRRGMDQGVTLRAGQFAIVAADQPVEARSVATDHRVTDGLMALYRFDERAGDLLHNMNGSQDELTLKLNELRPVERDHASMTLTGPLLIRSQQPANAMIDAIRQTGELTVEAWIAPAKTDQQATIITLAADPDNSDFELAQQGDHYQFQLRTTTGAPAVGSAPASANAAMTQVVVVHDKTGLTQWYINGKPAGQAQQPGELSNWIGGIRLTVANDPTGDRAWLGTYQLLAVYDRPLNARQVQLHYELGTAPQPPQQ